MPSTLPSSSPSSTPVPDPLADALRRVIAARRVGELEGLDLSDDIERLHRLAARLEGRKVDEPRMQAALRMAELRSRVEAAGVPDDEDGPGRERSGVIATLGVNDFFPFSPYVGRANPVAPPVELSVTEPSPWREVVGTHSFSAVYNGPPDGVHGGVIAGVFDEVLGSVCAVNDVAGFTGTLTVRYRSLTPLDTPITIRGWLGEVEGRKTFAHGTFHDGDTLCAEAEGIFIGGGAAIFAR